MKYIIIIVVVLFIFIGYAILPEIKKRQTERKEQLLEEGVALIEMDGYYFDVPLRYMYREAIEIRDASFRVFSDRVRVNAFSVSFLLPDLRSYHKSEDSKWNIKGYGDRLEANIFEFRGPAESWSKGYALDHIHAQSLAKGERIYKEESDIYGLRHYSDIKKEPYDAGDLYYGNEDKIEIKCDPINKPHNNYGEFYSPGCMAKTIYKPNLIIEYTYGRKYLPQWKIVDEKLKAAIDAFSS